MHMYLCLATIFAHAASLVLSAPAPQVQVVSLALADGTVPATVVNDSALLSVGPVSAVDATEINSYIPYEWFAQATYCPQPSQANWSCSEPNIVHASGLCVLIDDCG